jgi:hypothetical protein
MINQFFRSLHIEMSIIIVFGWCNQKSLYSPVKQAYVTIGSASLAIDQRIRSAVCVLVIIDDLNYDKRCIVGYYNYNISLFPHHHSIYHFKDSVLSYA